MCEEGDTEQTTQVKQPHLSHGMLKLIFLIYLPITHVLLPFVF
jgi:hypothetical protein